MYRMLTIAAVGLSLMAAPVFADHEYRRGGRDAYVDEEEYFENQERFWKEERRIRERELDVRREYREAVRRAEERYQKELSKLAERRRQNYRKYGAYVADDEWYGEHQSYYRGRPADGFYPEPRRDDYRGYNAERGARIGARIGQAIGGPEGAAIGADIGFGIGAQVD